MTRLLLPLVLILAACGGSKPMAEKPRDHEGGQATSRAGEKGKRALVMDLFMQATQARLKGDLPKAVQLYQATLKEDPANAASMFELSKLYNQARQPEAALALAKKAVETDKGNIWYRFLLADLSTQNQDMEGAAKAYRGILQQWPDRVEVYYGLANVLAQQKKVTEARQVFRDLEKRVGSNEELVMREYDMLANAGRLEEARDLLTKALQEHPEQTRYYGMLAEVYDTMGDSAQAIANYEKALALDPDDSMARIALAQFHYNRGERVKGFALLKQAFADPDLDIDPKMQLLLGLYEMTSERNDAESEQLVEQSHALVQELKKAHPQNGKPFSIEGDLYMREGKSREARDAFAQAVIYEPDRFPIWAALLQLDAQLNDYPALSEHATKATDLFPTQAEFYLYKGIALSQQKKYDDAIEALVTGRDLVVDNKPLEGQFWSSLGDTYNELKDFPRSDDAYDHALAINPDDATVLNNYAYYLSERGEKLDQAEAMSRRANDISPNTATYIDTYAWVLFKKGKYAEARTWQEKAIALSGPGEGVLMEHLGDILFKLGDNAGAVDQWRKAKEAGGASALIDRKISEGRLVE
jgi:tetratricopeptide (TPR) repeat protein